MVRNTFLLLTMLFASSHLIAQDQVDIETWSKASSANLMRSKVLVVGAAANNGYPKIESLGKNNFFAMIGLVQPSIANTHMFFLVNEIKPASTLDAAKILKVDYAFESSDSNTKIIHVPSEKSIVVPVAKGDKDFDGHLRTSFGFDGYVVDSKEGLLLVKYVNKTQEIGSQAIVLDSEEPFISTQSQIRDVYLVEMIEKSGDFGIFKVVIGDANKKIPAFAKIQFSTR